MMGWDVLGFCLSGKKKEGEEGIYLKLGRVR